VEGGTLVTIEGSNLGLKEEDVLGRIHIGGTPCTLVEYDVSVRILCRTGSSQTEKVASVVVGNQAGFTESSVHFSYKVNICFLNMFKLYYCAKQF
jgi:plexin A